MKIIGRLKRELAEVHVFVDYKDSKLIVGFILRRFMLLVPCNRENDKP